MISSIHLGNFKAFGPAQRIPIRPITLIFGPNSGGKSSLIHGILLAHHAATTGILDVQHTDLGGESVDLGGFQQYVHRRRLDHRVEWGVEIDRLEFTWSQDALDFVESERSMAIDQPIEVSVTFGLNLDDEGRPANDAGPEVLSCDIRAANSDLFRLSRRSHRRLRLDRIELDHPVVLQMLTAAAEGYTDILDYQDRQWARAGLETIIPDLEFNLGSFLPTGLSQFERPALDTNMDHDELDGSDLREVQLRNAISDAMPTILDTFMRHLEAAVTRELETIRYLGPLRSYPPRRLTSLMSHDSNWRAGGGFAWDILRTTPEVLENVNHWLGSSYLRTNYELIVKEYADVMEIEEPMVNALYDYIAEGVIGDGEAWALSDETDSSVPQDAFPGSERIEIDVDRLPALFRQAISQAPINKITELFMRDTRTNTILSHRDVGVGISQVLPVLVSAFASQKSVVAIEQPEIHLHPALQAELADVFIQSALNGRGNTFILETHSEHIILRVMRRMRDTARQTLPPGFPAIDPSQVAVLYVEPDGSSSVVRELVLDKDGELLSPWPGGFFEESFNERFS